MRVFWILHIMTTLPWIGLKFLVVHVQNNWDVKLILKRTLVYSSNRSVVYIQQLHCVWSFSVLCGSFCPKSPGHGLWMRRRMMDTPPSTWRRWTTMLKWRNFSSTRYVVLNKWCKIKPLNLIWHATVLWINVKSVEFLVVRYLRFLWPPHHPPPPQINIFTSINKQSMKQCSNSLNIRNKFMQWHPHKPNPQKLSFQFG